MEEEWKPVEGFEDLYEISSLGRLKSYKVSPTGKIMKLTNSKGDYISIVLQGIGKERKALGFIGLLQRRFCQIQKVLRSSIILMGTNRTMLCRIWNGVPNSTT